MSTRLATEIGPGWEVTETPRLSSHRTDRCYRSPTGTTFRSKISALREERLLKVEKSVSLALDAIGISESPDGTYQWGPIVRRDGCDVRYMPVGRSLLSVARELLIGRGCTPVNDIVPDDQCIGFRQNAYILNLAGPRPRIVEYESESD